MCSQLLPFRSFNSIAAIEASTRDSADYLATARVGMDRDGTLYIADLYRARIEYPEQRHYIVARVAAEHGIEEALHGKVFVQDLLRERGSMGTRL